MPSERDGRPYADAVRPVHAGCLMPPRLRRSAWSDGGNRGLRPVVRFAWVQMRGGRAAGWPRIHRKPKSGLA